MPVRDIEISCRELLLPHLDPGEDSVGTRVEIDPLAPALPGMAVTIGDRVAEAGGRAAALEASGSDAVDSIVRGRHVRCIVDVAHTRQRLAAQARKERGA